jgi:DNA-binding FadR family transcriptional regulator
LDKTKTVLDITPLTPRRKHEEVAHQIRELAVSGRLLPGSRLPTERDLARKFRVSRTAIRDAFLLLESQGFLMVKRGRNGGAYVQEMQPKQLAGAFGEMLRLGQVSIPQLLDARLGIETSLLDFVRPSDAKQSFIDLERNVKEAWRLSRSTDPASKAELLQNLHEFHHLLAAATGNPVFILAVGTIMSILQKYLDAVGHHTCVSLDSVAEHQAILEAIKRGRVFEARKAVSDHLLADSVRMADLLRREMADHAITANSVSRSIETTRESPRSTTKGTTRSNTKGGQPRLRRTS